MGFRRDTTNMTEKEILSEIYIKVEILDDIVRGDPDRDMAGLQQVVKELRSDLEPLKKGRMMRQVMITSSAAIITTLASVVTVITLIWQLAGV